MFYGRELSFVSQINNIFLRIAILFHVKLYNVAWTKCILLVFQKLYEWHQDFGSISYLICVHELMIPQKRLVL